jgi:hypothetical protein
MRNLPVPDADPYYASEHISRFSVSPDTDVLKDCVERRFNRGEAARRGINGVVESDHRHPAHKPRGHLLHDKPALQALQTPDHTENVDHMGFLLQLSAAS